MNLKAWFALRGPQFVARRGAAVLGRYGVTAGKAQRRVEANVAALAARGCAPSFPTPGRVVEGHLPWIRSLQAAGAEIAVHSYDHFDLRTYPTAVACEQLMRAADVFMGCGVEVHGFRCPYLSCTDEIRASLPAGAFGYSSNDAYSWNAVLGGTTRRPDLVYGTIEKFYQARPAEEAVCVPYWQAGMVEIPVCVPDDLQLCDGAGLQADQLGDAWAEILCAIHERGELFTLLFHPELAGSLDPAFATLLDLAQTLRPRVWLARLRDINQWWREKATFKVHVTPNGRGLHVAFECSDRATILARGLALGEGEGQDWSDGYRRVRVRSTGALEVPALPRPFLGLAPAAPAATRAFLANQGYIVEQGETAAACGIFLDEGTLARLPDEVSLVNYIEAARAPLLRFGRWPDGAAAALCVTGDLDALSLLDYGSRLFAG